MAASVSIRLVLHSRAWALAGALVMLSSGCGGSGSSGSAPFLPLPPSPKGKHFDHIVIIVQENRTFDNLFATFPGADGTRVGKTHKGSLRLRQADLYSPINPRNRYNFWKTDCDAAPDGACRMDGFDTVPVGSSPGTYVYEYVNPAQIKPYWAMAQQYVLGDHFFQPQGSSSFTAHQDLIRGATDVDAKHSLVDLPTSTPWGCDAPPGTVTSLITNDNRYEPNAGPFPCLSYRTLRDVMDAGSVSWRYYSPDVAEPSGAVWAAFDAIRAVRYGPEWSTNQVSPEKKIFTEVQRGSLPGVSWVIPDYNNSDHAGRTGDTGPSWVAQVVNAIGQSSAWDTTAILILWDDWGGWYDHVPPPGRHRAGGLGFRVPFIVVSPFAKSGYISHAQYSYGSILRFVEDNWNLDRLGTSDQTSADFVPDFFDFKQQARPFKPIEAQYSKEYFLRQAPSGKPVDED